MSYIKAEDSSSTHSTEPQGADTSIEPSLDMAVFDSMKSVMEDEFVDLIEAFYLSSDEVIATMDGWQEWQASDDYRRQPHSLKSIAANIGAMRLKQLAELCEAQISNDSLDEARTSYALIREEYQQVKQQLQSLGYSHSDALGTARAANH